MSDKDIQCSFCGRRKDEVDILIAGATGHICDRCVEQAEAIVLEEATAKEAPPPPWISPCVDPPKSRPTSTILSLAKKQPSAR